MANLIKIFIVNDLRLLREGLISLLVEQADLTVIGTAASGSQAIQEIKALRPEVAIIDICMPDKRGIAMTRVLHREAPDVKVIILGVLDLKDEIMECIEAGAAGYVLKEASFDHLVQTIRAVHRGESLCSPQIVAYLFSRVAEFAGEHKEIPKSSIKLTVREREILKAIAQGQCNKGIAQQLGIELQTVKNHVHNILDKLQMQTRLEAAQYARERNLLEE